VTNVWALRKTKKYFGPVTGTPVPLVARRDPLTSRLLNIPRSPDGTSVRHRITRRVLPVVGLLMLSLLSAEAGKLTEPDLAAKLGISVQQVQSLRARFELTTDELLGLSAVSRQLMLLDVEHPGIDKHAEEERFRALRLMDEHGRVPPEGLLRALEHRRQEEGDEDFFPGEPDPSTVTPSFGTPGPLTAGIQNSAWTWLGPGNIGGRVRSIVAHPTATNILWCGGVDGGVWKTTNSGAAWFPLNDFMANLAISCLVIDPANPNVIYAGTGEGTCNGDAIRGAGIFKTTDGGTTWTRLPLTVGVAYQYVSRLSIAPSNSLIILAATRNGLFRSTDAGTNWSQSSTAEMQDVMFHPGDSNQAIATGPGKALYSSDGGLTWASATGLPSVGRVEATYSRAKPTFVFASVDHNGGEIYLSTNGGQTYSLRNTGNNYLETQGC